MIGYFGKQIIFETSDKRIMSFTGLSVDIASRYEKHDVIMKKPKTEFIGPDLDLLSFTINLNGSFGVKPRAEMEKWAVLARDGIAETFVIGGKPLGSDKWVVKSVSQAWDTVFNQGELFSGKIDVTLEEYIEDNQVVIISTTVIKAVVQSSAKTSIKTVTKSTTSSVGTVTATILNVRKGPGLTTEIIGKLYKNNKVKIDKKVGSWYSIYFGDHGGYVYNSYIKLE